MLTAILMTEISPLELCQKHFGSRIFLRKRSHPNWRDVYTWTLTNRKAELFLKTLRPLLIVKAKQADVAIAFIECYYESGHRAVSPYRLEIGRKAKAELENLRPTRGMRGRRVKQI